MADPVGRTSWLRPASEYENYCDAQGVPVYRGILGVRDVRELDLAPWERMGGRGAFIDLDGTGGYMGQYVVEIPPGGALHPERHLYEEVFYVLEGRGSTEVWLDDQTERRAFEWQQHSIFACPLNTWHCLVNASSKRALILVASNAPPVMELYRDLEFVFGTPYHFRGRYNRSVDYFTPWSDLETEPLSGRALNASAIVPDAAKCALPYDGQRGSGHRYFRLRLAGNMFEGFLAEYPPGRYSKTHAHESGPVLVCISGQGYTLTWPKSAGTTPWRDGNGNEVRRQDYVPGGLVSAAPGGAEWFHAHFGTSPEPFRVMAFLGGYPMRTRGLPGSEVIGMNRDIKQGGNTIEYRDEDPAVRAIYKAAIDEAGAPFDMAEDLYR